MCFAGMSNEFTILSMYLIFYTFYRTQYQLTNQMLKQNVLHDQLILHLMLNYHRQQQMRSVFPGVQTTIETMLFLFI